MHIIDIKSSIESYPKFDSFQKVCFNTLDIQDSNEKNDELFLINCIIVIINDTMFIIFKH